MTSDMVSSSHPPRLLLVGAMAPFGAEILNRMLGAGFDVIQAKDVALWRETSASSTELDVLIVNVPVTRTALRFDAVDDGAFQAALQTQFFDVVQAAQAALPRMRIGARIVFVGSRGHLGAWGGVHLMAASAALVAMMRSMALELTPEGIRVNMVAADFALDRGDTPTLRAAITHAVEFLCSAELGISGETLLIDGNASLRMGEARDRRPPSRGTIQNHPPGPAGHLPA